MPRRRSNTTINMKMTERHSENVFFAQRQDTFFGTEGVPGTDWRHFTAFQSDLAYLEVIRIAIHALNTCTNTSSFASRRTTTSSGDHGECIFILFSRHKWQKRKNKLTSRPRISICSLTTQFSHCHKVPIIVRSRTKRTHLQSFLNRFDHVANPGTFRSSQSDEQVVRRAAARAQSYHSMGSINSTWTLASQGASRMSMIAFSADELLYPDDKNVGISSFLAGSLTANCISVGYILVSWGESACITWTRKVTMM